MIKQLALLGILVLITSQQTTITPKTQRCDCSNILNQQDCGSHQGCVWIFSNSNNTDSTNNTSPTGSCNSSSTLIYNLSRPITQCNSIKNQTLCSKTLGCANFNNTCILFSGCSAYVQSTNSQCQAISSQCTTDGTRCVDPSPCQSYNISSLCLDNIASSGAKTCKWVEKGSQSSCADKVCSDNTNNGYNRARLQFIDQFLIIRQGDIIKQHCDIIAHFFNNQLEASDKILKFGGSQYKKHAENLLSGLSTPIDEIHYKIPNSNTIKHIISIPLFQNSISDIQVQLKNNIQLMFSVADKQEFKSLVIQIQNIQENDLRFFFNQILMQMQNSKLIKNIVIIENQELKIDILVKELKEVLNPKILRQIKYQWQWYDEGWKDYDDEEINRQIDEAYEQYQNNNNQNEINLLFPYTKLPGTHTVDLHNMIVTNISTYHTENISYNNQQYFFNGIPVDQQLNQYIEIQNLSNQLKFQIFLKRYKIVFKNQNKIIQINQDTKYERKIRFQLYQKQQIQQYPIEALYQFEEFQIKQNSQEYIELVVKGYAQESIINAQSFINDLIDQNTSTISRDKWGQLNKIKIYSLKQENQLLADYLKKQTSSYNQIYPKIWKPQNINMIKVELSQNDEEYKKVSSIFNNSYQYGKIYQINRIQNKILYENFQTEKQKLIKLKQQQGQQLTQIELERYISHGVSNQHPQIIYSGLKEAFDCTYCQDYCLWGPGIYFAENSSYSKSYSYTLSLKDSPQYSGKLIFLLCLVATGKVKKLDSDKSLKRPPDGYDCVQGQSGGSDIYILYQMDVRRAYPSYEVIYE